MLFVAFLCLLPYLVWVFLGRRRDKRPPGPFPFPIVGNMPQILASNSKYPHLAMSRLAKKYGDIMSVKFGVHELVVISSHELMKEVLVKSAVNKSRLLFPLVPDRAFGKIDMGIIWNRGASWQELKRFTVRTLKDFGFGKNNTMSVMLQTEVGELVGVIKSQIGEDGVWKVDSHLLGSSALNIVWNFASGMRFSLDDPWLHRGMEINENVVVAAGFTNRYTAFPWVKKVFPKWSKHKQHLKCYKDLQDYLGVMINEIEINVKERDQKEPGNFVEVFLSEIEKRGGKDENYTREQLIVILQDFFLAGSESSATTVNWLILYAALYPDVQKKIQKEIQDVIGIDTVPSLDHMMSMPYLKAFVLETFRTAIIAPMATSRVATEEMNIRGYTIPKGTGVVWNMEPVLSDKAYWRDPKVFRPERFLKMDEAGNLKVVNTERITMFGFGARACPGEGFTWSTVFIYAATLFQAFEFSVISGKEPSTFPNSAATLTPQSYSVRVKCRGF